jgi:lysophospholipase L1-like esterase
MTPRRALPFILAMLIASSAGARTLGAPPTDGAILFFGDSITEGWMDAVRFPAFAFPGVCDSLLRYDGIRNESENLGRAGETSDDALHRIDGAVLGRRPAVVVIAFGSNDWYIHGFSTTPRVSLDRFEENLRLLVWKLQGIGAVPILLGLPPVIPARYYRYSSAHLYEPFGGVAAHRGRYADAVARVAAATGARFVPVSLDTSESSALLGFDGLHPTAEAHRLIAAVLRPAIEEALPLARTPQDGPGALALFPQPLLASGTSRMLARVAVAAPVVLHVRIADVAGREWRSFDVTATAAGTQYFAWDCVDAQGLRLPGGIYVLSLQYSEMTLNKKFLIL